MRKDPSLKVGESSGVKIDEEHKIEDKHDQSSLSHCRVNAFTKVIPHDHLTNKLQLEKLTSEVC